MQEEKGTLLESWNLSYNSFEDIERSREVIV